MSRGVGVLVSLAFTCATADVITGTGVPSATTLGQRTATRLAGESGGIGHALILPYYNTQNGNASVFSITNTDLANGKVVKVRVRGASDGDSLLSLIVLLGPGDVWNATLSRGANGITELVTHDATCAVPRVAAGVAQPLSTARLTYLAWSEADKANQTREGYVEILTMADIQQAPTPLFAAIGRNRYSGTPCGESPTDAMAIADAVSNVNHASEASAAAIGLAAPTSGIAGKWLIINVPETTTFAGSMYALRAVDGNGADARANFVLFPQTDAAYNGAIDNVTSDPLLRSVAYATKTLDGVASNPTTGGPILNAAMRDLPDLSTPYIVAPGPDAALAQADRLHASMAVQSIQNEYSTEPTLAARTAWVISMPARRYSVVMDNRAAPGPGGRLFSLVPPAGTQYFSTLNTSAFSNLLHTASAGIAYVDREGNRFVNFITGGAESFLAIGGAASILDFGDSDTATYSIARSRLDLIGPHFANGWMVVGVGGPSGLGMPVIGNALIRFSNPSASPGISGNYGITFDHWMTR